MWSWLVILTQSYWRDEAFSVLLASRPLKELFGLIVRFDHTPPFFYYLQHFWLSIFGTSEIAMRSLSFGFHLLAVYFVLKLTKSRLAALAVGLNPFLWQYAFEARHYSLFAALVLGGVYFYSVKKICASVICWSLALITHNFAWVYFGVWLMLTRDKRLLPALLPGLAWLPWLWQQANTMNEGQWLGLQAGWWWFNSLKIFLLSDLNYVIKPLLLIVSLALLVLGLKRWNRLLSLAIIPLLLIQIISRLWIPLYLERYLLPSLPLLVVGIGLNLKKIKWIKPLALIYLAMLLTAVIFSSRQETKPPMRQAVAKIVSAKQLGEIIVTQQPINYLEVYYYLKQSGNQDRLYSLLLPGEDKIPYYVGVGLIKPWQEIVAIPEDRDVWLIKPDASVIK